ncbi:hypothetical protein ACTAQI_07495 [Pseudarthrobacter sp. alpha12b]
MKWNADHTISRVEAEAQGIPQHEQDRMVVPNIRIQKTQECSRCYQARRRAENPEAFREKWRQAKAEAYVPAELLITAAVPPTTACSYDAAHQRVKHYRGYASKHVCPCGAQAQEWSYRGGSSYEMQGAHTKRYNSGKQGEVFSTWSTNITDYDALCRPCHEERDLGKVHKGFFLTASSVPPSAPHFLSLTGCQEAL